MQRVCFVLTTTITTKVQSFSENYFFLVSRNTIFRSYETFKASDVYCIPNIFFFSRSRWKLFGWTKLKKNPFVKFVQTRNPNPFNFAFLSFSAFCPLFLIWILDLCTTQYRDSMDIERLKERRELIHQYLKALKDEGSLSTRMSEL